MRPILNPNLEGFFESDNRYYVLYGGRASGKTYHTAGFCVFLACEYSIRFLCVRQFQNRLSDSVKSTIENCIEMAGLRHEFKITENEILHIKTGSIFSFLGINRNLNEIKGMTGIEILWIEEAEGLNEEQWKVIMPTVRAENSKIFLVFNPRLSIDFIWKKFVVSPMEDSIVRKINYNENPYLSNTMKKVIEQAREDDNFSHVYLGEPLENDEEAIIKRSHVTAAIDAHAKLGIEITGRKRTGFDPADGGRDSCATIDMHGNLVTGSMLWKAKEDELVKSCKRAWVHCREIGSSLVYDAIGVGAFIGGKIDELNQGNESTVAHQKFWAGGAVLKPESTYKNTGIKNKDYFANIKAQSWWDVSQKLQNTYNAVTNGQKFENDDMIFIDGSIDNLQMIIDELCTPRRAYNEKGQLMVETKKELSKRDIMSPNLADAFIMSAQNIKSSAWDSYQ